jgi:hypothetical protein
MTRRLSAARLIGLLEGRNTLSRSITCKGRALVWL